MTIFHTSYIHTRPRTPKAHECTFEHRMCDQHHTKHIHTRRQSQHRRSTRMASALLLRPDLAHCLRCVPDVDRPCRGRRPRKRSRRRVLFSWVFLNGFRLFVAQPKVTHFNKFFSVSQLNICTDKRENVQSDCADQQTANVIMF